MSESNHVPKLLRLKRYEKPPEDYFDDFLIEFQRRQRADLLKRPMWEMAWERANIWLDGFRVPAMAYAAIVVAAAGVTGVIVTNDRNPSTQPQFAAVDATPITSGNMLPSVPTGSVATVSTTPTTLPPSYVLEKRPVSYESPFSF